MRNRRNRVLRIAQQQLIRHMGITHLRMRRWQQAA